MLAHTAPPTPWLAVGVIVCPTRARLGWPRNLVRAHAGPLTHPRVTFPHTGAGGSVRQRTARNALSATKTTAHKKSGKLITLSYERARLSARPRQTKINTNAARRTAMYRSKSIEGSNRI